MTQPPSQPRMRKTFRKTKEKTIESYFVESVKRIGGFQFKLTSPSFIGVPDRLAIIDSQVIFVELKRPGGKPEKHQLVAHAILRKHKMRVEIISTKDEVDEFIASFT